MDGAEEIDRPSVAGFLNFFYKDLQLPKFPITPVLNHSQGPKEKGAYV